MSIQISNNSVVTFNSNIEKLSTTTSASYEIFSTSQSKNNGAEVSAKCLLNCIIQELNLSDNYIIPSIEVKNGTAMLKLTRKANDKLRSDTRDEFRMGEIKSKLGIKDGVLSKYNDMGNVTGRTLNKNSDSATMEAGKTLVVPIKELGQRGFFPSLWYSSLQDVIDKFMQYSFPKNSILTFKL